MSTGLSILLVEDNSADARLVREALAETSLPARLHWVADGEQALVHLRQGAATAARPDVILLDLNLPGLHGLELLRTLKADPALQAVPVVVLTSSAAPLDLLQAHAAHVNSFFLKPAGFDELVGLLDTIGRYWSVHLGPPQGDA